MAIDSFQHVLSDVTLFCKHGSGLELRRYQVEVARAVCASVLHEKGLSFVVMFPRQSGKNELQAQIEAYLLTLLCRREAEIVKVSPTWKPQSLNAMRRLERVLKNNLITSVGVNNIGWQKERGYIYRIGQARVFFLSGAPEANIVGATASTLLEVDEAQDVSIAKFDKDIAPMAASTNATRVFWGTAWTSASLLARELRAAREAEARDGLTRAFVLSAETVAQEVPAYGVFVAGQVARLGRDHPMVRSQFFSEEIGGQGGMFTQTRLALMEGDHPRQMAPCAGEVYAFLLDVAGEDEGATASADVDGGSVALANPRRDSTALTIVAVDVRTLDDPGLKAPTYRVVDRHVWQGWKQIALYAQVRALAERWNPRWLVVDATGVGAGLASFLEKALPGRVLAFTFSSASKSALGWDFLAVCDTGRFRDWAPTGADDALRLLFTAQARACQFRVREGPARLLAWGVPDGTRDPVSGAPVHDDLLVSAALCALLDRQTWYDGGAALVAGGVDPLAAMDAEGF